MRVVGVDGYTKGWVVVVLEDGSLAAARLHKSFVDVLAAHRDAEVIAVDIPIGLPQGKELRAADVAAKKVLASGASRVFAVPPRAILEASTYAAARELATRAWGRGLTAQSFALARKILEVDAHADERIYEVHPEVSFWALKKGTLSARKKSWNGALERRALLAGAGITLPEHIKGAGDAVFDDLLDAAAAAWSAHRIASGTARSLPPEPETIDERRVAIWY
ncbi:MAG: DUF429 domain-containing protein [Actinomycetota bacterium]